MSARNTAIHVITKAGTLLGALFLVGVLLAAIPAHKSQPPQASAQKSQSTQTNATTMPGMDMSDEHTAEAGAMHDMSSGAQDTHSLHMHMTAPRPQAPGDVQRANAIVTQLRSGIEKYKDHHVALDDGFEIFMPDLPQPEYHFTNYKNGFLGAFNFDPSRPTSLLYKKASGGYELVGAMYTMPKRATEDQLNARVPLSVASWHLHTNLCLPPHDQMRSADFTKFGRKGSIATHDTCEAAGGRFQASIFGWMVHVYPYENGLDKIFTTHHHMD